MAGKMYELLQGDCIEVMKGLEAGSVQTCVTSPPYYGLRDYGTATWEGGSAECDHVADASKTKKFGNPEFNENRSSREATKGEGYYFKDVCGKCGARRIDNQIGLEETPDAYVAKLVEVFREVKRLLRDDGTLWLNLGDSFLDKQLLGIPWKVAFALQADGWVLRSDIVWAKSNPMPESVLDRPTKSHEYIFLLSKSREYFYDADAIREPNVGTFNDFPSHARIGNGTGRPRYDPNGQGAAPSGHVGINESGRNRRSVWTVSTKPYSGAHFATFPPDLIEPCILAGTSAHGCCAKCGAAWEREVETEQVIKEKQSGKPWLATPSQRPDGYKPTGLSKTTIGVNTTIGWQPTCTCNADVVPCTVLDPFNGSGTTGAVALKHGRRYIGIELNPDYLELAHTRITQSQPMLAGIL